MYKQFIKNIISLAIIILLFIVFINHVQGDKTSYKEYKEVRYTVSSGDTLWSIAGENIPSTEDRRLYVDEVRRLNNLDNTNLKIGQELIILTQEER